MSIHLLPRPLRPSDKNMMRVSMIMSSIFCNASNAISHIQDIEINAFRDGVNDIKTVEKIAMKKPKMMVDLLAVVDICIEAFEAQARLLESRDKGPSRKKEGQEVNTADRGDQKDRGGHRYHGKQSSDQKEKRPFRHSDDAEKWCKIHRINGHNLEEYKTFLNHKRMLPSSAGTSRSPLGEHRREIPDGDKHMAEVNVIFGGSMTITSKTQGKKLQHEISLAQ
jgi:hypothetical protein